MTLTSGESCPWLGLNRSDQKKQMDEMLAPKNATYLLANVASVKVVIAGMEAITLGELDSNVKAKVMALAVSLKSPVADTTTTSNVCSAILSPALKVDALREGDGGAIQTFADVILNVKSSVFLDVFRNAAAESITESDASSEGDAGEENAVSSTGNAVSLSEKKLEQYLTLFSAMFLSDCIKMRLEELVGINDDIVELVLRCSMSIIRVNLAPIIMKGKIMKKAFIFQGKVDHSGILKICDYLAAMFENAVGTNEYGELKGIEFWNKKIMLQAVPGNAQLLSRGLAPLAEHAS